MSNESILTKDYQTLTREEREIYDHELDMIRVAQCAKTFDYNKGMEVGMEKERIKSHQQALQSAFNIFTFGVMSVEQIAQSMNLDVNELNDYIKVNSTKV